MTMQPHRLSLSGLSDLKYDFTLWADQSQLPEILVVSFHGLYDHGSLGNGDGRLMAAIVSAGVVAWQPSGLVLDLRDLDYEFGNTILGAINVGYDEDHGWLTPTRIVVSSKSSDGLNSLMEFVKRDPADWLCPDVEQAIERVLACIRED